MEALTLSGITFYKDDTIETIQQLIALREETHPHRLFIEVLGSFPSDYYSKNPNHWLELFERLSTDGATVSQQQLDIYLKKIRLETSILAKAYTLEQWKTMPDDLRVLYEPNGETFTEWRILGVDSEKSTILDVPPSPNINIPSYKIPIIQNKSLFETYHPYEVLDFRITHVPENVTDAMKRVYFPNLTDSTPLNIQNLASNIEKTQTEYKALISLSAPSYQKTAITKVKWRIPLISTRIHMPYTQFEQMFYGITLSKDTPYIGMFTNRSEAMRHKFYVEDPKQKQPYINPTLIRNWLVSTMPQRRKPTLLIYRGNSNHVFDRISVTDVDIIIDVRRDKENKESEKELKEMMVKWMKSLDSVVPFFNVNDLAESRWELDELSIVATYKDPIEFLNRGRVNCLQSIFGAHEDGFRLLRSEHSSQNITPQVLQAYRILNDQEGVPSISSLADEMQITDAEAQSLIQEIRKLDETNFNFERALKEYPMVNLFTKDVVIQNVSNAERVLRYVDILRYVLTQTNEEITNICPEDLQSVQAVSAVPQNAVVAEEPEETELVLDIEGAELDEPEEEFEQGSNIAATMVPQRKSRTTKVTEEAGKEYGYFYERLKKFDPDYFKPIDYPKYCEKKKQVIALTEEDKQRIRQEKGPQYAYDDLAEDEQAQKMNVKNPDGTYICPPYWCVKDEIPLREDQLTPDETCPICGGKIQTTKNTGPGYTVIRRDTALKYPGYQSKTGFPCCFKTPNSQTKEIQTKSQVEDTYILREYVQALPALRASFISDELAERLKITTDYTKIIQNKNRLLLDEANIFLIGLGHPSETLPKLFKQKDKVIPNPIDVKDKVMKCSFFQQWRTTKEGETSINRILEDINHAYIHKEMNMLHELEYVTMFLECEVILINPTTYQVHCGFWSNVVGANSRTIAVIGENILGYMKRKKSKGGFSNEYVVNLRMPPFDEHIWPYLRNLHKQSCAIQNMPTYSDALQEAVAANRPNYKVILDPLGRMQALIVPGDILIPFLPTNEPIPNVDVLNGYANLTDTDLPNGATMRTFLQGTNHPGLQLVNEYENSEGQITELGLSSGLRVPIQPENQEAPKGKVTEIVETVRKHDENLLVEGPISNTDKKIAQVISYSAEVFEFLMYSLSKDIEMDRSGEMLNPDFTPIRNAIMSESSKLYQELKKWFKNQGYVQSVEEPIEFINKVRTPCGQMTDKDVCQKSTLCGWHKKTCKIKVNPVINVEDILKRMAKTLKNNPKQRALILDNRLSPFFSTILYFELPHELITTDLKSISE
jgi:hypothetical protein